MRVTFQKGERKGSSSNPSARPQCIVIGLGNPILGDDGVGWRVAQEVQSRLNKQDPISKPCLEVEFDYLSLGGLSLMERLIGFRHALIIDAIASGGAPIGEVMRYCVQDFDSSGMSHLNSIHDTSLHTAIQIGRSLNVELPDRIEIITVEIQPSYHFRETLTDAVAASIPRAADLAINVLAAFS